MAGFLLLLPLLLLLLLALLRVGREGREEEPPDSTSMGCMPLAPLAMELGGGREGGREGGRNRVFGTTLLPCSPHPVIQPHVIPPSFLPILLSYLRKAPSSRVLLLLLPLVLVLLVLPLPSIVLSSPFSALQRESPKMCLPFNPLVRSLPLLLLVLLLVVLLLLLLGRHSPCPICFPPVCSSMMP